MTSLIDRYIFDVVRRLPEQERGDVSKELQANIYDMLPEGAGEAEIKAVLLELGPPTQLAEQYRQKPRYLISPAYYDDYIRALKLVLPLVGGVLFGVGLLLPIITTAQEGVNDMAEWIGQMLGSAVSMSVSAVIQTLLWITVGFVIADRVGAKAGEQMHPKWKPEDLPEITPATKGNIPLVDCIAELIVTFFAVALTIVVLTGNLPFIWVNGKASFLADMDTHPLSSEFLAVLVPVMVVLFAISLIVILAKIIIRRWSVLIGAIVVTESILSIAAILFLVTRPNIFSPWVVEVVRDIGREQNVLAVDRLNIFVGLTENGLETLLAIVAFVVIAVSVGEMVHAIYKTVKHNYRNQKLIP